VTQRAFIVEATLSKRVYVTGDDIRTAPELEQALREGSAYAEQWFGEITAPGWTWELFTVRDARGRE
jgi:hypothetical protein